MVMSNAFEDLKKAIETQDSQTVDHISKIKTTKRDHDWLIIIWKNNTSIDSMQSNFCNKDRRSKYMLLKNDKKGYNGKDRHTI